MSTRRLLSALVVSLGLLPAGVAEAGFAPTNETVVESEQLSVSAPASDAAGNSIVAWSGEKTLGDPQEVKARRVSAAGLLGPVIELAPGEIGSRPAVAVTPGGRAFIAWEAQLLESDPRSVKGRWVEPDGALGPILTLVEGVPGDLSAGSILVAIDPAGVASVVWSNLEDFNRLALRRVQPDGTLGTLVPDFSGGGVNGAQIVALPDGSTAAVWRSGGIQTTTVDPSLAFAVPTQISATALPANPEIAVDGLGNALVVWRAGSGEYGAFAHRLDAAGAPFGSEIKVDPLAPEFISQVFVAADGANDFLITWERQNGANEKRVLARGASFESGFTGPAQTVSNPSLATPGAHPALFDNGIGAIAWMTGATSTADLAVGRQVDQSGLPTGPIQDLFAENAYSGITVASAPAAGVATFLFSYPISGSAQGAVVRRFLVPPVCTGTSATVVQGKPVFIPISCTGPALEGAQQVGPPAHGSLTFDPATLGFTYAPAPGFAGTDSFTYAGLNDGGASGAVTVAIAVGKDTVKPRIKTLKLVKKLRKRDPRRYSFKFRLAFTEPATAKLTIKQVVRVRGKAKLRKLGTLRSKKAGLKATVAVKGKLASRLGAGGRFRVVAVATDAARNKSAAKKLAFRVG